MIQLNIRYSQSKLVKIYYNGQKFYTSVKKNYILNSSIRFKYVPYFSFCKSMAWRLGVPVIYPEPNSL